MRNSHKTHLCPFAAVVLILLTLSWAGAVAQEGRLPESEVTGVTLEQRLGERLPLHLEFVDSHGDRRLLGEFFGARPVVLVLGYYECPNLCTLILNGATDAFAALTFQPGREYDFVFVSIDPNETPPLAAANKRAYSRHYGRSGTDEGWHFLTGEEPAIQALAEAVGFHYEFDPMTGQFAHSSGIMVVTPDGVLSKYFYGIEYNPRDLRLGLVEAGDGGIGSPVDQLLLLCFHYNPLTGQYGLLIDRVIKIACGMTVLVVTTLVLGLLRAEKRKRKELQVA